MLINFIFLLLRDGNFAASGWSYEIKEFLIRLFRDCSCIEEVDIKEVFEHVFGIRFCVNRIELFLYKISEGKWKYWIDLFCL